MKSTAALLIILSIAYTAKSQEIFPEGSKLMTGSIKINSSHTTNLGVAPAESVSNNHSLDLSIGKGRIKSANKFKGWFADIGLGFNNDIIKMADTNGNVQKRENSTIYPRVGFGFFNTRFIPVGKNFIALYSINYGADFSYSKANTIVVNDPSFGTQTFSRHEYRESLKTGVNFGFGYKFSDKWMITGNINPAQLTANFAQLPNANYFSLNLDTDIIKALRTPSVTFFYKLN